MQRYNIFNLIHKGLRASLYQTALQLQQTDFTDEEETEEALNKIREIILLIDGHAHKEDSFILPTIREFEPSVVATFDSEHETGLKLGEQLNVSINKVASSETFLEKLVSGRELTDAFIEFMIFNLKHMAKEEAILNRILWRFYSDGEIKEIGNRINKDVAPWIQDFYTTWILRGINNTEVVTLIKTLEKGMPPVVYHTLLNKVEKELPRKRFIKVRQSLTKVFIDKSIIYQFHLS